MYEQLLDMLANSLQRGVGNVKEPVEPANVAADLLESDTAGCITPRAGDEPTRAQEALQLWIDEGESVIDELLGDAVRHGGWGLLHLQYNLWRGGRIGWRAEYDEGLYSPRGRRLLDG